MERTNSYGRGTARSTPWVPPLTYDKQDSGEPGGPVVRLGRTGVRPGRTHDGDKPDVPRERRLRVGSVNVGTMAGRSAEVWEMVARRRLDFCCVQESGWKGEGARMFGGDGKIYKFFWKGNEAGLAGVGIFVAEEFITKVVEVKRVSDRILVLRVTVGKTVLNLISAYAPQVRRPNEEKEDFWVLMGKTLSAISDNERLVVCGDMNGHVGEKADGFESVHGGLGYGERNVEGEMLLEFAEATDLIVVNTWFTKGMAKRATYESGGRRTQIDYVLVRKSERGEVRNLNVIGYEECIPQHKLLVCVLVVKDQIRRCREKNVSRCRIWRLREASLRDRYMEEVQSKLAVKDVDDVEGMWSKLKGSLLESADTVCGRTKGRPKHRETWWWNDEVAEVIKEKQRLFKVWKKSKMDADRKAYQDIKKKARAAVYNAQEAGRKEFGAKLDEAEGRGQVFKVARQIVQKNKDVVGGGCVKDKEGKLVTEEEGIKEVWKAYFDKLLNEEFEWDKKGLERVDEVCGLIESITVEEVNDALGKAKSGKAAGPSGVLAEMLKAAGDVGVQWVTDLCNAIVKEGRIPDDWRKSWMVSVYKGKGDALECGSYRGIKLLDQVMKIMERIIERKVRKRVQIDDMQFGFRPGRGTIDAIFIVRQMQEKYLGKKKDLWMAFVDLEKAFDRVPREVVWWALRKLGVEEWLVRIIMSMYEGVTTAVKTSAGESEAFPVKVGLHQGSVLSPLLFIIVLEALARTFRIGLPWELLYADDLVLIAESEEELLERLGQWKCGFEKKGLKVNVGKTKVMKCSTESGAVKDTGTYPCPVCSKGVGNNSIQCKVCKMWVHKKCSGVKGQLKKETNFSCRKCKNPEIVQRRKQSVSLEQNVELECVDEFCYLGDMIGAGGGAGDASRVRVRCAWKKFTELSPILTTRGASLKLKGKIYRACVRSVMIYGSETWPMKVEDGQRLERTERMMMRRMCGVTLKDRKSSEELRGRLGLEQSILDLIRKHRLQWYGHVERKSDNDWVKKCRYIEVGGVRGRGRGIKTWQECVNEDKRVLGMENVGAGKRGAWKEGHSVIRGDRLTRARMDLTDVKPV